MFAFYWSLFLLRHTVGQTKIKVKNEMLLVPSHSMWSLASLVLYSKKQKQKQKPYSVLDQHLKSMGFNCLEILD